MWLIDTEYNCIGYVVFHTNTLFTALILVSILLLLQSVSSQSANLLANFTQSKYLPLQRSVCLKKKRSGEWEKKTNDK
jgi:hypothetical protein